MMRKQHFLKWTLPGDPVGIMAFLVVSSRIVPTVTRQTRYKRYIYLS